jgi:preprotein translocase subunit SecG
MLILKILLIAVEIICSFLLIVMILLQRAKGEGLGLAFGAEMGESLFGARASNVLVKATMWLGTIFIINTVVLAIIYSNVSPKSILEERPRPPVEQPFSPAPASMPMAPVLPAPETQPQTPASQLPVAP